MGRKQNLTDSSRPLVAVIRMKQPDAGPLALKERSILAGAPEERRLQLLDFYSALGRADPDMAVVLVARRAYCLYRALLDSGEIELGNRVPGVNLFSSRVLDWVQPGFAPNERPRSAIAVSRSVMLVDDSCNEGAVLKRLYDDLLHSPDRSLNVYACTQTSWAKAQCDPTELAEGPHEMLRLSEDVYRAINGSGYPYFVDLPIYDKLLIQADEDEFSERVQSWNSYDVSNEQHTDGGTRSITFVPDGSYIEKLRASLPGWDTRIELCKVRTYLRSSPAGLSVQFVPKVTLAPMSVAELDRHIGRFKSDFASGFDFDSEYLRLTPTGKFRLLQYAASVILGEMFIDSLPQGWYSEQGRPQVDLSEVVCHTHPAYHHVLTNTRTALEASSFTDLLGRTGLERIRSDEDKQASSVEMHLAGLGPVDAFKSSVAAESSIDRLVETAQPTDLGELTALLGAAFWSLKCAHRDGELEMQNGLSPAAPFQAISDYLRAAGVRVSSSEIGVALDILGDLGVSVPVIRSERDQVFRGYRFGENTDLVSDYLDLAEASLIPGGVAEFHDSNAIYEYVCRIRPSLRLAFRPSLSGRLAGSLDRVQRRKNGLLIDREQRLIAQALARGRAKLDSPDRMVGPDCVEDLAESLLNGTPDRTLLPTVDAQVFALSVQMVTVKEVKARLLATANYLTSILEVSLSTRVSVTDQLRLAKLPWNEAGRGFARGGPAEAIAVDTSDRPSTLPTLSDWVSEDIGARRGSLSALEVINLPHSAGPVIFDPNLSGAPLELFSSIVRRFFVSGVSATATYDWLSEERSAFGGRSPLEFIAEMRADEVTSEARSSIYELAV
jgi:hypothetical protein